LLHLLLLIYYYLLLSDISMISKTDISILSLLLNVSNLWLIDIVNVAIWWFLPFDFVFFLDLVHLRHNLFIFDLNVNNLILLLALNFLLLFIQFPQFPWLNHFILFNTRLFLHYLFVIILWRYWYYVFNHYFLLFSTRLLLL
jgi:hypothetical protein